jgi:hypothetical protein
MGLTKVPGGDGMSPPSALTLLMATLILLALLPCAKVNVNGFSSTVISSRAYNSVGGSHLLASSNRDNHNGDLGGSDERQVFNQLLSMDQRLGKLERSAAETLFDFYEPHLSSFSIKPGTAQALSVTSTCFSILSILSAPSVYSGKINADMKQESAGTTFDPVATVSLRSTIQALLSAEWREEDMFQVPLLLYTVLGSDTNRNLFKENMGENYASKVRKLVSAVLAARPKRRNGPSQQLSFYIMFLSAQAMAMMQSATTIRALASGTKPTNNMNVMQERTSNLPEEVLPEGASSQLYIGLERSTEVGFNELCRQLAYHTANDNGNFDIMRLAYSMLIYITSSRALTNSGTAGRELIPGDGPMVGTAIPPPNNQLIQAGLKTFFSYQESNGLWPKGQPIYKTFRKTGRNVGNAFVFSLDTLGSLLELLPSEMFRPYLFNLQKTLTWMEQHQIVEIIPEYCDPESGQCYGKPLRGWTSPHLLPETSPQAWSTAQTLTCVHKLRSVIQDLMHKDVMEEFGGIANEGLVKKASWDRLLDTDLSPPGAEESDASKITLKSILMDRVLVPFDGAEASSPTSVGAAYSTILFGPPGTAKTTICEAIADRLGWDFLVIDTSAFLADGLTNVASRIRYVFERLQRLQNCVILFDEIEEFCLDRERDGVGMESRMLTTAMLTAINNLRREKSSIFFMATNRLRALDAAITRPGRFDLQLFVGTPNLEAKVIQLRAKLDAMSITSKTTSGSDMRDESLEAYRAFLESVWEENGMFMNYLEGLQFAQSCADLVAASKGPGDQLLLTQEAMEALMKRQAAVMTVRGQLREEYRASMELSRW